jgi:mono/diheme cytochrome c family protein
VLVRADRLLAALSWVAAACTVVLLLIGPRVIANDKSTAGAKAAGAAPYAGGAATASPDPAKLFVSRCGSCHTLAAAGTKGTVGPALDGLGLDAASVAATMRAGPGAMPSFSGDLSDAEIAAVAAYVARSSGG